MHPVLDYDGYAGSLSNYPSESAPGKELLILLEKNIRFR